MIEGLRSGHWPTLVGAWCHLTVSFMVWLLFAALAIDVAETLSLSVTQTSLLVAVPLLGCALLRVLAGWSCDLFGAKRTGLALLIGELGALLWGWIGGSGYVELLALGFVLGLAGASFAVTLPVTSRAYPASHQGLALGLVASGNVGAVFVLALAPMWAEWWGWHDVFGVMTGPVLAVLVLFYYVVQDDRHRVVLHQTGVWWHSAGRMLARPSVYWLCGIYAITFGGFVGLISFLPLFFHGRYSLDPIAAGSLSAVCGLIGSLIRPFGGHLADRKGGLLPLRLVLVAMALLLAVVGQLPSVGLAGAVSCLTIAVMGIGNGIVFQIVAEWFPRDIGLASGLVGAAGGFGGFVVPIWLSALREFTGTFTIGFLALAGVVLVALSTVGTARRWSFAARTGADDVRGLSR